MKAAGFAVALSLVLAAFAGTISRTHAATTVFCDGKALLPVLVDPGVGVGVGASRQDPGDRIEVRRLDLREAEQGGGS